MRLDKLTERLELSEELKAPETDITAICFDTRKEITPGCLFVCIRGAVYDSHDFAVTAAQQGAAAIIADHPLMLPKELADKTEVIVIPSTRRALSIVSSAWFGYPAEKLTTIGITGTKGKSTTSYMIRNILEAAGHRTGVIGTLGVAIGDELYPTGNTTPESYFVQEAFDRMVKAGCDTAVMEVSSQGLKQSRVYGVYFDYALFTNLEPDHIGKAEHDSFEEYRYCKSLLFKQCGTAIVNGDDANAPVMLDSVRCTTEAFGVACEGKSENLTSLMSTRPSMTLTLASGIELVRGDGHCGISFDVSGTVTGRMELAIPGRFNVCNALAAIAVCSHFVSDAGVIAAGLAKTRVKGRLEPLAVSDRFTVMIDYAHNAMALESLLRTLREYDPGRLVCLFGCGGNRAKDRRFEMGEVSSRLADLSIITSDNPRMEKPEDIIADILVGVKRADGKYVMIEDRREAIAYAIANAKDGDMIVLAGKGNEDYQEIMGVKYPMDERVIVSEIVGRNVSLL